MDPLSIVSLMSVLGEFTPVDFSVSLEINNITYSIVCAFGFIAHCLKDSYSNICVPFYGLFVCFCFVCLFVCLFGVFCFGCEPMPEARERFICEHPILFYICKMLHFLILFVWLRELIKS